MDVEGLMICANSSRGRGALLQNRGTSAMSVVDVVLYNILKPWQQHSTAHHTRGSTLMWHLQQIARKPDAAAAAAAAAAAVWWPPQLAFFLLGLCYGSVTFKHAGQIHLEAFYAMPQGRPRALVGWMAAV